MPREAGRYPDLRAIHSMLPLGRTPSWYIYHFCKDSGICITCRNHWARAGLAQCMKCGIKSAKRLNETRKKLREEKYANGSKP